MEPKWSHPPPPDAAPPEATLEDTLLLGLGTLLGLLGSVMINVGNNVQALGMGHGDGGAAHREKRGKTNDGGSHTTRLRNSRRAV